MKQKIKKILNENEMNFLRYININIISFYSIDYDFIIADISIITNKIIFFLKIIPKKNSRLSILKLSSNN